MRKMANWKSCKTLDYSPSFFVSLIIKPVSSDHVIMTCVELSCDYSGI